MLLKDADTQARWYYQLKIEFARAWPKIVLLAIRLRNKLLRWQRS